VVSVGIIALVTLIVVLLIEFGPEGNGRPRQEVVAGPAEGYALADVNAFDLEHFHLVRFSDGTFRAFYDRSTKQQEIPGGGGCRIRFDETAGTGALPQIEGMRGAFVEECDGSRSVWRVDGTFSFGSNYGDLDEFETYTNGDGDLVVVLETRTCTRSVGVPGIEPFERRECRGAP
jgi:hypothetical protein